MSNLLGSIRSRWVLFTITACLYSGILLGGAYPVYRHFHVNDTRGISDATDYLEMYEGRVNDTKHRYRVVIPIVARIVPVRLFSRFGQEIASRPAEFSFFCVNMLQTFLATGFLHAALRRIGFAWLETVITVAIFLSSPPMILGAALPLVDAPTYLAAAAMLWAIVADSTIAMALVLVVGTFVREPIALLALCALASRRFRWWVVVLIACVGVTGWVAFKSWYDAIHPYVSESSTFTVQARAHVSNLLHSFSAPLIAREFLQTYLAAIPFALMGWRHRDSLPLFVRDLWPWVVVSTLMGLVLGNIGRISFIGFAAWAPFVALGLREAAELARGTTATSAERR